VKSIAEADFSDPDGHYRQSANDDVSKMKVSRERHGEITAKKREKGKKRKKELEREARTRGVSRLEVRQAVVALRATSLVRTRTKKQSLFVPWRASAPPSLPRHV